ncbi:unnamed protein product [Arctia plantaginis]|uniref:Uncharacterized protein n=1 Tax=Arctia plantaginis TaxID=874455 RepID=A0A8S0ZEQ1_ARCPL|nr:unnamed protein product [Arctia plantaginis]
MEDKEAGALHLRFAERVFRIATERNKIVRPTHSRPSTGDTPTWVAPLLAPRRRIHQHQIVRISEIGRPGLDVRRLAHFMSESSERLGVGFCRCLRGSVCAVTGRLRDQYEAEGVRRSCGGYSSGSGLQGGKSSQQNNTPLCLGRDSPIRKPFHPGLRGAFGARRDGVWGSSRAAED